MHIYLKPINETNREAVLALSKSYREGGLLKKETARRMLTPVMGNYGLCVHHLEGDMGCHDGWNEGFLSTWIFSLRTDLSVALMLNRSREDLDWEQSRIAMELFRTAEKELAE